MANFRPYNAASTLSTALSGYVWPAFYFLGVVACVFHLANGVWTMGITWGVWVSPRSQRNASIVCAGAGVLLLAVGMSALVGARNTKAEDAKKIEDAMYDSKVATGEIVADPHKRSE